MHTHIVMIDVTRKQMIFWYHADSNVDALTNICTNPVTIDLTGKPILLVVKVDIDTDSNTGMHIHTH